VYTSSNTMHLGSERIYAWIGKLYGEIKLRQAFRLSSYSRSGTPFKYIGPVGLLLPPAGSNVTAAMSTR
jgi:hypothetical protein